MITLEVGKTYKTKEGRLVKITKHEPEWNGEYIVYDLMNKRFKNRIDILINPKDEATMFSQAKLILPE